jgi:DNA polymerase-4
MPAEILQRMIGKMESRFGKSQWHRQQSCRTIYGTQIDPTEHTFVQDTIDMAHLKAILCGMVESWLFNCGLRSG